MIESALGRRASDRERRALLGFLVEGRVAPTAGRYADVAHLIFNMSEFIFLR